MIYLRKKPNRFDSENGSPVLKHWVVWKVETYIYIQIAAELLYDGVGNTVTIVYRDRPIMRVFGLCTTVTMAVIGQPPNLHIMAGIISLAI